MSTEPKRVAFPPTVCDKCNGTVKFLRDCEDPRKYQSIFNEQLETLETCITAKVYACEACMAQQVLVMEWIKYRWLTADVIEGT